MLQVYKVYKCFGREWQLKQNSLHKISFVGFFVFSLPSTKLQHPKIMLREAPSKMWVSVFHQLLEMTQDYKDWNKMNILFQFLNQILSLK